VEVDEGVLRSNVELLEARRCCVGTSMVWLDSNGDEFDNGLWLSLLPCLVSFVRGSTKHCLSFDRDLAVERESRPVFESLPFSSDVGLPLRERVKLVLTFEKKLEIDWHGTDTNGRSVSFESWR
jgi:hypothetical protein